jgi:hypothetical protein
MNMVQTEGFCNTQEFLVYRSRTALGAVNVESMGTYYLV